MMLYIYDENVITILSPIFSCVISFLCLCICFLLFVCNILFLFHTKMSWWVCLKCFKNTSCQSLLAINFLLEKFFKGLCYDRFYCIQQVWVKWFMTSLICSFFCCGFVTDCQKWRLLGHMWIMLRTYVNIKLINLLTKRTLLVIW